ALVLVPEMPRRYDEPFADSSQLPTCLVAQLARSQVTVALSGDGGDELFCGYDRYFQAERAWAALSWAPGGLRRFAAQCVRFLSTGAWDRLASITRPITPVRFHADMTGDRIHKLADLIECRNFGNLYRRLMSHWTESV